MRLAAPVSDPVSVLGYVQSVSCRHEEQGVIRWGREASRWHRVPKAGSAALTLGTTPEVVTPSPLRPLTPRAAAGWRALCTQEGVTQTALAEALGHELARIADSGAVPAWLRPVIEEARSVAGQRRER